MSTLWSRIGLGFLGLALVCSSLQAEPGAAINDPAALAALIDHYIGEGYAPAKATPAPLPTTPNSFAAFPSTWPAASPQLRRAQVPRRQVAG